MRAASSSLCLVVLSSVTACVAKGPVEPPSASANSSPVAVDADKTWTDLTTALPGTWAATTEQGATLVESFRLVSRGSALVESYAPGTKSESATIYHRDGASILLTHYCAQGNQPRLRAQGSDSKGVAIFRFVDVTDLGPDEDVMIERRVQLTAARELVQSETYKRPNGTLDTTTLRFVRRD